MGKSGISGFLLTSVSFASRLNKDTFDMPKPGLGYVFLGSSTITISKSLPYPPFELSDKGTLSYTYIYIGGGIGGSFVVTIIGSTSICLPAYFDIMVALTEWKVPLC